MDVPTCSRPRTLSRFLRWLGFLSLAIGPVLLAEPIELADEGRKKIFELPNDEVYVGRWGSKRGELARELPATIPGTTIVRDFGRRVMAKLPAALDRAKLARGMAPASKALASSDWELVIYQQGVKRTEASTRTITREVLVTLQGGDTAEQVRKLANAKTVRETSVPGHVILAFANPYAAIDGAKALEKSGRRADLMLGRILQRMAAPNDTYFTRQWHLRNTGQGGGAPGIDANVVNAWDISRGTGVHIVINDDSMQTQSTAGATDGHPDLSPNTRPVDSGLHYDFRDGDQNPNPEDIYDAHGTAVSGVAGARGNNGIGVSGAAPEANLVGLRTIGSFVNDSGLALSVKWSPGGYDAAVSNNSWGYTGAPGLRDLGILVKNALRDATINNRGGLGQITVFANGNSQEEDDNGNFTTLTNSRFVIAVGAIDNFGFQSYYSNPGANLLISAPSNGDSRALGIFTTDVTGNNGYNPRYGLPGEPVDTSYTANFGGTSSATPLTTGTIALVLGATPTLGWRDVHEILAQTARKIDIADSDWATNGAGFHFNHKYGAGMIDATAAVVLGRDWVNLGAETSVSVSLGSPNVPAPIQDNNPVGITRDFNLTGSPNIRTERIELQAKITTVHRSDLEVALISPDGTKSILAPQHARPDLFSTGDDDTDYNGDDNLGWTFTSTHHWGENSQGIWKLQVRDLVAGTSATLQSAKLTVYGTASPLQRVRFAAQRSTALENTGVANIRVERLGGTLGTVTVDYLTSNAVTGESAIAGTDYTLSPGTLTFADGESFKDISVAITDNAAQQGNRFIYLILKNPVGAALGGSAVTRLDIIDDESNLVTVAPGDFNLSESGTPASNTGTFVISRSKPTAQALTVTFTLSGTAEEDVDYAPVTHSAVIAPNASSAIVTITPLEDDMFEGLETIILTVDEGTEYGLGSPAIAQLNLADNDLPAVKIEAAMAPGNIAYEQGPTNGVIHVSRPTAEPSPLVVRLSISGTAISGVNYQPIENFIVIPADQKQADISIVPIDNDQYSGPTKVIVRVSKSTDYALTASDQAEIAIIDNDPTPDPKAPTITLSSPPSKSQIAAPAPVILNGTAKDNIQVDRILVAVNSAPFQPLPPDAGIDPWTSDITSLVVPGINVVRMKSVDVDGNESPVLVRNFSYIQPRTLSVSVDGSGTVSRGFAPSSQRNAGFNYVVTASPAPGSIFAGWDGAASGNDAALTFTMPDSDAALTAHFISNPFTGSIAGGYQGLVQGSTSFAFETSGFVSLKVTTTGTFTGWAIYSGIRYPLKGRFTGNQPAAGSGRYLGTIKRKAPLLPVLADLRIDLIGVDPKITGTIKTLDGTISDVVAKRAGFDKRANPYLPAVPKPQLISLHLPAPNAPTPLQPHGDGFASLSINAAGTVKANGKLPDGSKFTQTTVLSKDATWPLFVNLYSKSGVALGDMTLASTPAVDLSGAYDWFKPSRTAETYFLFGFTLEQNTVTGEIYTAPVAPARVLTAFDAAPTNAGTMQFREGNLILSALNREFDTPIQMLAGNKIAFTGANAEKVSLKINSKLGTFTGAFVHPFSGKKTPIGGVILQKSQRGVGGFLGTLSSNQNLQTGRVIIAPAP